MTARKPSKSMRLGLALIFCLCFRSLAIAEDFPPDVQKAIEQEINQRRQQDLSLLKEVPSEYQERKDAFIVEEKLPTSNGFIQCRIINMSNADIHFTGYSASSPWYRLQTKTDGKWEEVKVGWFCGTGLGLSTVPPNKSVVIEVDPKDFGKNLRVGIDLVSQESGNTPSPKITIWSKE